MVHPGQLSDTVLHRSKRMILDSIGVGLLGSSSHVFELALQHCQVILQLRLTLGYGTEGTQAADLSGPKGNNAVLK